MVKGCGLCIRVVLGFWQALFHIPVFEVNKEHTPGSGCLVGFYDASFYKCGDCLRSMKRRHLILRDE